MNLSTLVLMIGIVDSVLLFQKQTKAVKKPRRPSGLAFGRFFAGGGLQYFEGLGTTRS